jgi:cytidine deaminase
MIEDINKAKEARLNSYSPYSNYQVGACLRCKDGSIYTGCNVENDGIQSICAERCAFVKAISDGKREFESIAIVGAPKGTDPVDKCVPCGYCRQFISEFVDNDFKIILEDKGNIITYSISDLLPDSFRF